MAIDNTIDIAVEVFLDPAETEKNAEVLFRGCLARALCQKLRWKHVPATKEGLEIMASWAVELQRDWPLERPVGIIAKLVPYGFEYRLQDKPVWKMMTCADVARLLALYSDDRAQCWDWDEPGTVHVRTSIHEHNVRALIGPYLPAHARLDVRPLSRPCDYCDYGHGPTGLGVLGGQCPRCYGLLET